MCSIVKNTDSLYTFIFKDKIKYDHTLGNLIVDEANKLDYIIASYVISHPSDPEMKIFIQSNNDKIRPDVVFKQVINILKEKINNIKL